MMGGGSSFQGVVKGVFPRILDFFFVHSPQDVAAILGGVLRNFPPPNGKGMGRKLTPDEETAYADLARAAARLRKARTAGD